MTVTSAGSHGEPVVTDPPTTIADFAAHAAYTRLTGNRIVGTASNRTAFSTTYGVAPWAGLTFLETDTLNEYLYTGSAWVGTKFDAGSIAFTTGSFAAASGGYAATAVLLFRSNRFTAPPVVSLGVFSQAAENQHAGVANVTASQFTLYFWRASQTATTIGWTALPADS